MGTGTKRLKGKAILKLHNNSGNWQCLKQLIFASHSPVPLVLDNSYGPASVLCPDDECIDAWLQLFT
ncbi:hypothetical protein CLV24_113153 [Pontibacter ummariensis]|uniref:Uncharacterized protein n=1 Tax=Pontibacter ummariensis TaxID=1610492 RepID=A0A239H8B7_9BACT|nr:hypothetical protein CLV24_113153 [Pontibacter ummariensis]SNS77053.1 hypothetical protein SAMN06296052_1132 [Pontibacter ummariensis]